MKRKILIGSIFAALILLSMPVVTNIAAQPTITSKEKNDECSTCPKDPDDRFICKLIAYLWDRHIEKHPGINPLNFFFIFATFITGCIDLPSR